MYNKSLLNKKKELCRLIKNNCLSPLGSLYQIEILKVCNWRVGMVAILVSQRLKLLNLDIKWQQYDLH